MIIKRCLLCNFTETAINIGYSCQLLTDEMEEVFVIDAEEKDEVLKQLEDALKHIDDVKKGHKDHVDAEVVYITEQNRSGPEVI